MRCVAIARDRRPGPGAMPRPRRAREACPLRRGPARDAFDASARAQRASLLRYPSMKVVALAGGIGAGKFLRGPVPVVPPAAVTAIVNTGDDVVMHGLHVSPDID